MMTRLKNSAIPEKSKEKRSYPKFSKINGKHPLKEQTINSYVDYKARTRDGGSVALFNFSLAKELGLIPKDHPEKMNNDLCEAILETFGIIIINEYDQENEIEFPEEKIRKNSYMATRYLQLQHPNKKGETSGDGRSIWNGTIRHSGKIYDISSCGTGATRLSPATAMSGEFFQSGDPSISYGCGYQEVDEGFIGIFFSEVLKQNSIPTERVLAVLEFEDGFSTTVRVHENLLRPSHLFSHLKQGNLEASQKMVDYFIERQIKNKVWRDVPEDNKLKYRYFLERQIEVFAQAAADYEDQYLFVWLDWDGDNVLMDGGIIDYGSVRQFGLFHHEYRFDDGPRFSTTISEQKEKSRYIAQTFAQLSDFLITKNKKPIKTFSKSKDLKKFDDYFWKRKYQNLLFKMGFSEQGQKYLFENELTLVKKFQKCFSYFERVKSKIGPEQVNDGINWNAIFCMRDILRELPQLLLIKDEKLTAEEFIDVIKSSYAIDSDLKISKTRRDNIEEFQTLYKKLVAKQAAHQKVKVEKILLELTMRSSVINKYDRITGDSITSIINKIMERRENYNSDSLYQVLEQFKSYQNLNPDHRIQRKKRNSKVDPLMKGIFQIVKDFREGL